MRRFATYDRYLSGALYEGAILTDVTIEDALSDTYFGTRKPSELSVRIALGPATEPILYGEPLGWPGVINGGMETWTLPTTPDNWTVWSADGLATCAQDSVIVHGGAASAALTRNTAVPGNSAQLQADLASVMPAYPLSYWRGWTVRFSAWVWAAVPNVVSIGLWDGSAGNQAGAHPGDSVWRQLQVVYKFPLTSMFMLPYMAIYTVNQTARFDDLTIEILFPPRRALFSVANRGAGMRVYGTEGDVKTLLWDGIVGSMELGDNDLAFNGTPHPISVLESLVPMETALLTPSFATDRGFAGVTTDAGSYVGYVVGNVPRVRGFLVNRDLLNNLYDYAFATGAHQILNTYRSIKSESGVGAQVALVTASEYTVSTTLYPGFTVARFVVDQIDNGGALYTLYADLAPLVGSEAERLPSRMIRSVLEGYGQTCVATSFAAADELYTQQELGLDFAQLEQATLLDLFRDGLMLLDGILTKTSAGWTLSLDQRPTTIRYQFQEGSAADVPTILSISPRKLNPLDNATRNVVVKCTPDLLSDRAEDRFLVTAQRTVSTDANASDLPIELPQVRRWAIADWFADRKYRQILTRTETLQITGPHLAGAQLRDLVQVTSPRRNLTAAVWQVTSLSRSPMGQPVYSLEPWSPDWYVYELGVQPNDPLLGSYYDFSRTVPPAITDLTFPSGATFRGTEIIQGGAIRAFITIRYTTPVSGNFSYALPRYRPDTSTIWIPAGGPIYQTGTVDVKIRGLNPGIAYEFSVQSVNKWGLTAGG